MPKPKKDTKKGSWDRKKNAIMHQYRKLQKSKNGKFVAPKPQQETNENKMTFFNRAMNEYERRKAIKEERKQLREIKRKEREEAMKKYAEKKRENFKKLSAKTKYGQPVMKGRIEILLERIQKSVDRGAIK